MSGIDAPQPWHAIDPKQGPPPNGTRVACPLCGCAPGEAHRDMTDGWQAPRAGTPACYGPGADCDPED